jgi:hypothetical protein
VAGLVLRSAAAAALVLLLAGCVQTVVAQPTPELSQVGPIHKVAIVPFSVGLPFSAAQEPGGPTPASATSQVAHQIAQKLQERDVQVVAPGDVGRILAAAGLASDGAGVAPAALGRLLHQQLGADAFLLGKVHRFVEREGRPAGATRPAAVGFQVALYDAPAGQELWVGTVDERQQPLGANVFDASRYPGHGFRWLSVDELAAWCAGQAAEAIPLNH